MRKTIRSQFPGSWRLFFGGRRVNWIGVICFVLVSLLAEPGRAQRAGAEPWMEAVPTSTGPAIGEKIPPFRVQDQFGKMQDFNSIRGPKGAVILFNRSADW